MALVFIQGGKFLQVEHFPIDPDPAKALPLQAFQEFDVFSLAIHYHRGQYGDAAPGGELHNLVHHLGNGQGSNGPTALVEKGQPRPGKEHPQIIVNFGGGGYRGTRVLGGAALLDGDGRRQALNVLHVRLVHQLQELPGVSRKAFHVAPLSFGIENVEGQGGLPRAAYPRDDDEAVTWQFHVNVFQVVFPGPPDDDLLGGPGGLIQNLENSLGDG